MEPQRDSNPPGDERPDVRVAFAAEQCRQARAWMGFLSVPFVLFAMAIGWPGTKGEAIVLPLAIGAWIPMLVLFQWKGWLFLHCPACKRTFHLGFRVPLRLQPSNRCACGARILD